MQRLPRLALLLFAISPVTEKKDWIFYTNSFLIISLFVVSIIYVIHTCKKDRKEGLKFFVGDTDDNASYAMISLVGLIVSYSMDLNNIAWIWWLLLAGSLLECFWPTKFVKEKDKP